MINTAISTREQNKCDAFIVNKIKNTVMQLNKILKRLL